jgi:signal transduction histidine kinase
VQLYQGVMQGMSPGILVVDEAGTILFANPSAAALLEMETSALIGRPGAQFFPQGVPEDAMATHRPVEMRTGAGRLVPTTLSVQLLPAATVTGVRIISIINVRDLEQMNDTLFHTQRLASVGTLTASVAHELTNPLSIITATCSNMIHEVDREHLDPEILRNYIRMIEQNAWRSARMVEVLRHYTHHDELHTAVTNLNVVIEDALTLVRPQFLKENDTPIETDLDPDLRSIVCDHNRLTQVLVNLLCNARDAMQPEGGPIIVRSWCELDTVERENGRPTDIFAFSVRDRGPGIPQAHREKIFEPFFTTKENGSGLGLFIARRIVAEHNGRIWLENNADGGATFTVLLPQQKENAPA